MQRIGVADEAATSAAGWVMVMLVVVVHPLASVTVYSKVPAPTGNVPVPVYGAVPPVALTVTVAEPPKQAMDVADEEAANAAEG